MEVLTNPDLKHMVAKSFGSGDRVSFEELKPIIERLGAKLGITVPTGDEADKMLKRYDFNDDGLLTLDEFSDLFISWLRRMTFDKSQLMGRDLFVSKERGRCWDHYQRVKQLGKGSFGAAYLCRHKRTGDERVVKAVEKSEVKLPVEEVEKEIMVMMQIDHPHICRLYEWYEGTGTIYLIIDALKGGTLKEIVLDSFMKQGRPVNEEWIQKVLQQSLQGMAYCHSLHIIHKDLKDENIMLVNKGDPNYDEPFVVIIDLGVAEMFPAADPMGKALGGTPTTMAPEVWTGCFGPKCDVFSLGCVLYQLLAGRVPFLARSLEPEAWRRLHKKGPRWEMAKASEDGRELCKDMLTFSDAERPSMATCLEHKWFTAARHTLRSQITPELMRPLQAFSEESALKRALLLELAARLPMSHSERVVKVFKAIDKNQDGTMSKDELRDCFKQVGVTDEGVVDRTFEALDVDGNGVLSFTEFAAGVLSIYGDLLEARFRALFRKHDVDGDGILSKEQAKIFFENSLHMASRETQTRPDKAFGELFGSGQDMSYEDLQRAILTKVN